MVEVTQADRDAALDLDERHIIQVWNIDATARAFAEHRMRAVEAQAAEIQRLREGLLAICQETTDSFVHDYAAGLLEDDG